MSDLMIEDDDLALDGVAEALLVVEAFDLQRAGLA